MIHARQFPSEGESGAMHQSSYDHMQRLIGKYLPESGGGLVYDIGSGDVNGSYKPLFDAAGWTYLGFDLEAGANVDKVMESPYRLPAEGRSADLVVSGQAFEHIEYFWISWLEVVRVTKVGGLIFLLAPSRGPEHRHPVDCWRFYTDGWTALAKWGQLELLEASTDWEARNEGTPDADWGDTVGVFRKNRGGRRERWKDEARARFARMLA